MCSTQWIYELFSHPATLRTFSVIKHRKILPCNLFSNSLYHIWMVELGSEPILFTWQLSYKIQRTKLFFFLFKRQASRKIRLSFLNYFGILYKRKMGVKFQKETFNQNTGEDLIWKKLSCLKVPADYCTPVSSVRKNQTISYKVYSVQILFFPLNICKFAHKNTSQEYAIFAFRCLADKRKCYVIFNN